MTISDYFKCPNFLNVYDKFFKMLFYCILNPYQAIQDLSFLDMTETVVKQFYNVITYCATAKILILSPRESFVLLSTLNPFYAESPINRTYAKHKPNLDKWTHPFD